MIQFVQSLIERIGYIGVALLTAVENIFPPIPSEIVIPFAGFAAKRGESLTLVGVTLAGTVGSLVGAVVLYYVGYAWGEERIKRFVDRHGAWLGLDGEDIVRADEWFRRYGMWAVLVCRVIPGLRSLISVPAGIARMNLPVFLLWTTLGTLIWTALLAVIGYALGQSYQQIGPVMDAIGWVVFVVLTVLAVRWVWQRRQMVKAREQQQ